MRELHRLVATRGGGRKGGLRRGPPPRRRGRAESRAAPPQGGLQARARVPAGRDRCGVRWSARHCRPISERASRGDACRLASAGSGGKGAESAGERRTMTSWPGRLAAGLVRGYQLVARPLLPAVCRFEPSCSEYSRQAFTSHGLMRGLWWTARRLARCHPWHAGGYDPPPQPPQRSRERSGS